MNAAERSSMIKTVSFFLCRMPSLCEGKHRFVYAENYINPFKVMPPDVTVQSISKYNRILRQTRYDM